MRPYIVNFNMAVSNTEYSVTLPSNTKNLLIKTRTGVAALKLAYNPGESSTNYITIPAGATKSFDHGYLSGFKLYFQSASADIVEIEYTL